MNRFLAGAAAAAALFGGGDYAFAQAQGQAQALQPVDYGAEATWLCKPGRQDPCAAELPARVITPTGLGEIATFAADPKAPVDCFYVYPTVSADKGDLSDLTPGENEEIRAVKSQVARLRSVCRVFAPLYRQTTLEALNRALDGDAVSEETFGRAYADVRDAWRWYLKNENKGRGVVLVGHSQGAIHLWRLIAEEIDAKPDQGKVVLALLGGYAPTMKGDAGVTFKSLPFCAEKAQAGCAYVWNSYDAADASPLRVFGRSTSTTLAHPCVSPAAPGGGPATLQAILPTPPGQTPDRVLDKAAIRGVCETDAKGTVLKISVNPVPYAQAVQGYIKMMQPFPGWGLHTLDMSLLQGDLIDRVRDASATYARPRR